MKNILKLFCIIAITALTGLFMSACNPDPDPPPYTGPVWPNGFTPVKDSGNDSYSGTFSSSNIIVSFSSQWLNKSLNRWVHPYVIIYPDGLNVPYEYTLVSVAGQTIRVKDAQGHVFTFCTSFTLTTVGQVTLTLRDGDIPINGLYNSPLTRD